MNTNAVVMNKVENDKYELVVLESFDTMQEVIKYVNEWNNGQL